MTPTKTATCHEVEAKGYRLSVADDNGTEVAHLFLYVMTNSLGKGPLAYIEDLQSKQPWAGCQLVRDAIAHARELGCYKVVLVADRKLSRYYERAGFTARGGEFLIKFNGEPL